MDAMKTVKRAHDQLKSIIGSNKIEPLEAALEVERLRRDWKPENVRVVLLAESHSWTSCSEVECGVRIDGRDKTRYVRFVYCLGYGEKSIVCGDPKSNGGTWQYWRLFHDCVHGPDNSISVLKKIERNTTLRIQAKIELLKQMRERGLWLVDASVTALYRRGWNRKLVTGRKYEEALLASWDEHVAKVLHECRPEKVLVVGKAVSRVLTKSVLKGAVPSVKIEVVPQPNARLTIAQIESARLTCRDFCRP